MSLKSRINNPGVIRAMSLRTRKLSIEKRPSMGHNFLLLEKLGLPGRNTLWPIRPCLPLKYESNSLHLRRFVEFYNETASKYCRCAFRVFRLFKTREEQYR